LDWFLFSLNSEGWGEWERKTRLEADVEEDVGCDFPSMRMGFWCEVFFLRLKPLD